MLPYSAISKRFIRFQKWGLLASVCLLAISPGCGDKSAVQQNASQPFSGEQLRIAVPSKLGLKERWQFAVDEWAAQTGAVCTITEYEPPASLSSSSSENWPAADLIVFPVNRIAEVASARSLSPFPKDQLSESALNWRDVFKGLREKIGSPGRNPAVLPISCPVLVCYYRRDLLETAGRSQPETWDDYLQLIKALPDWAPGLTAVEPWSEPFRATTFLARAASYASHPSQYSLYFNIDTGAPMINTPGFVRALEQAQQAIAAMPADVTRYSSADCRRELLSGKAAVALCYEAGGDPSRLQFGSSESAGTTAAAEDSKQRTFERADGIQIGFCRLPGSPKVYNADTSAWDAPREGGLNRVNLTAFGGLCCGCSGDSSPVKQQAAANLLGWVAVRELEACFPQGTKSLSRESQLKSPAKWVGPELSPDEGERYVETVAEALREPLLVAELPVIGHEAFRAALTKGLGSALSGDATAEDALADVARQWEDIGKKLGIERVRDSYRNSLGLPPKRLTPLAPLSMAH